MRVSVNLHFYSKYLTSPLTLRITQCFGDLKLRYFSLVIVAGEIILLTQDKFLKLHFGPPPVGRGEIVVFRYLLTQDKFLKLHFGPPI